MSFSGDAQRLAALLSFIGGFTDTAGFLGLQGLTFTSCSRAASGCGRSCLWRLAARPA